MSLVNVSIHPSQFPWNVRRDLLESLRLRQVNHKFHYDSVKQTAKWLALHEAYSPARTDPDCAKTYTRACEEAVRRISAGQVEVVGLGCGGGKKDGHLLGLMRRAQKDVCYVPCDVSLAMVLEARRTVLDTLPGLDCRPLVCDLARAADLPEVVEKLLGGEGEVPGRVPSSGRKRVRLFTFFGMIPNFESGAILPLLAELVRPSDYLLLSANLAPGSDYPAGVKKVLPLYDNALTREWLMTFLLDLGIEVTDGELSFEIQEDPTSPAVSRIEASFLFRQGREISVEGERLGFSAGDTIRLFFSGRHTPQLMNSMLAEHGLKVLADWVTQSEEEGVFLVARSV